MTSDKRSRNNYSTCLKCATVLFSHQSNEPLTSIKAYYFRYERKKYRVVNSFIATGRQTLGQLDPLLSVGGGSIRPDGTLKLPGVHHYRLQHPVIT